MKTLFIPAKAKANVNGLKIEQLSKKLPKNLLICYIIQFKAQAKKIKQILSKKHKITQFKQILGCSKLKPSKLTQAILLIGSGRFHAISFALKTKLPIYILNNNSLDVVSKKDIESFRKKQKVSYLKFLHADKIGILVSTKPGQQNLKKALELKKKIKNKKSYLFISNNININEFENFRLNCWVNTACPRLDMDSNSILNIDKIECAISPEVEVVEQR